MSATQIAATAGNAHVVIEVNSTIRTPIGNYNIVLYIGGKHKEGKSHKPMVA
jgi:hypothetical protein